jgi:hypothetical protein
MASPPGRSGGAHRGAANWTDVLHRTFIENKLRILPGDTPPTELLPDGRIHLKPRAHPLQQGKIGVDNNRGARSVCRSGTGSAAHVLWEVAC